MSPDEATVRGSCVAIGGRAILLSGGSGSGKSDLALRLIDRGAALVSDDYTQMRAADGRLFARAPEAIAGKLEIRGVGIVALPAESEVPVCLVAELDGEVERMPEPRTVPILGRAVPALAVAPLEASAAIKLEWALRRIGLPLP